MRAKQIVPCSRWCGNVSWSNQFGCPLNQATWRSRCRATELNQCNAIVHHFDAIEECMPCLLILVVVTRNRCHTQTMKHQYDVSRLQTKRTSLTPYSNDIWCYIRATFKSRDRLDGAMSWRHNQAIDAIPELFMKPPWRPHIWCPRRPPRWNFALPSCCLPSKKKDLSFFF